MPERTVRGLLLGAALQNNLDAWSLTHPPEVRSIFYVSGLHGVRFARRVCLQGQAVAPVTRVCTVLDPFGGLGAWSHDA